MRIGFVQLSPDLGNVNATIRKVDGLIRQADMADILVLPELCNSGYNFESYDHARELSEDIKDIIFVRYMEDVCAQNKFFIVSGINERDNNHLYNTSVLIGPNGYIGKFRKLHLFMNEWDIFTPGDLGLPVFDTGLCKVGILICFDWIFPEVWRILALKGADLICHPSNLVIPGLCQRAIPVHALTNRIYVVTANRIGTEGDITFTGLSTIADPKGEVLAQASQTEEEVSIVDMDPALARDKMVTPRNHVFRDRRPEVYSLLSDSKKQM